MTTAIFEEDKMNREESRRGKETRKATHTHYMHTPTALPTDSSGRRYTLPGVFKARTTLRAPPSTSTPWKALTPRASGHPRHPDHPAGQSWRGGHGGGWPRHGV